MSLSGRHIRKLKSKISFVPFDIINRWAKSVRKRNQDYAANNPLLCIFTGMEHSGTTLISQMFNGHPRVASGIECGLLLSNIHDYDRVRPFFGWMLRENMGWALTREDRAKILEARSFDEAYCMLGTFKGKSHSNQELRRIFRTSEFIFDKTPRYVFSLSKIVKKINKPFIVIYKSPVEMIESYKKRSIEVRDTLERYRLAHSETKHAFEQYPERILIVNYRSIATEPIHVLNKIQKFVGLSESIDLTMNRYNERYGHLVTRGNKCNFRGNHVNYTEATTVLDRAESLLLSKFQTDQSELLKFLKQNSI